MINLFMSNGNVLVWNADDWLTLRKEYRILGQMVGCLAKNHHQEKLHGMPFVLLPEEVTLLLEKKIARLIKYKDLDKRPTTKLVEQHNQHQEKLFNELEQCLRDEKIKSIEFHMDRIIEGKKRKLLGLQSSKKKMKKPIDDNLVDKASKITIDKDALMAEKISKIPKLEKSEILVQIPTACPWADEDDDDNIEEIKWNYPVTQDDKTMYMVYKDLWDKKCYVTTGERFGGDYLAYPGDPILYHSQFIVKCVDKNEEMSVIDLAGQCRLATHVKKTQVFAYINDDEEVCYQSFNWGGDSYS
ncbi:hypothetical protein HCN44_008946 [Aphidius gifuensis]|uniref:tRNA-splicing endonuclease subunit Sen34 n=1 Tax=Aphidius gifuensis TaxID=684658 RepID=A0A834XQI9_APHGI|nr:tRNA-splicing endonuclease subunit Sen34 [Aphidius gifuensis]KAF7991575.1 hypothetical protein HCN44_008946 [Aphidius gifuensis]